MSKIECKARYRGNEFVREAYIKSPRTGKVSRLNMYMASKKCKRIINKIRLAHQDKNTYWIIMEFTPSELQAWIKEAIITNQ